MSSDPGTDAERQHPEQVAEPIDVAARDDALARWSLLHRANPPQGRLEDVGAWMCSVQAACPPRNLHHPVIVFVTARHVTSPMLEAAGIATEQRVEALRTRSVMLPGLASARGVSFRMIDTAIDPPMIEATAPVASADAMTVDEATAAIEAGRQIVDDIVDSGGDLIAVAGFGPGSHDVAASIVGLMTHSDPVAVSGQDANTSDVEWMASTQMIRDAMHRGRNAKSDAATLLATVGGPDIAVMTGMLLQSALRRTPVILEGLPACAAALIAHRRDYRAKQWWIAAENAPDPAHALALERLGFRPLVNLEAMPSDGTASLLALGHITTAIAFLRQPLSDDDEHATVEP